MALCFFELGVPMDKVSEVDAQTLDELVLVSLVYSDIWRRVAESINESFYLKVIFIDIMLVHH